jgi:hypothetical protein
MDWTMVSNAEGTIGRIRTIFYLFRFRYEVTARDAGMSLAGESPENHLCRQAIADIRTELALPSHDLGMARVSDANVRAYLQALLAAYDEGNRSDGPNKPSETTPGGVTPAAKAPSHRGPERLTDSR